jgi:Flp pilus assembly protein TadD
LLGIGGVLSTQYDKAIARLELVVARMPDNLEAVSWLADAYAGKGDKVNAVKWYNYSKKLVNNPDFSREVDQRISQLK